RRDGPPRGRPRASFLPRGHVATSGAGDGLGAPRPAPSVFRAPVAPSTTCGLRSAEPARWSSPPRLPPPPVEGAVRLGLVPEKPVLVWIRQVLLRRCCR